MHSRTPHSGARCEGSPKTNLRLPHTTLIPNINLRNVIQSLSDRMPELQRLQLQQLRARLDVDAIPRSCEIVGALEPFFALGLCGARFERQRSRLDLSVVNEILRVVLTLRLMAFVSVALF